MHILCFQNKRQGSNMISFDNIHNLKILEQNDKVLLRRTKVRMIISNEVSGTHLKEESQALKTFIMKKGHTQVKMAKHTEKQSTLTLIAFIKNLLIKPKRKTRLTKMRMISFMILIKNSMQILSRIDLKMISTLSTKEILIFLNLERK